MHVSVETEGDDAFSRFLKERKQLIHFHPLCSVVKYYLMQNRVEGDDRFSCLIPLSVLFCLTVLRHDDAACSLGDLLQVYLQFFGNDGNLTPSRGKSEYSFLDYCNTALRETHISLDLKTSASIRYLHVSIPNPSHVQSLSSLFRRAYRQIASSLLVDDHELILAKLFSNAPRLSVGVADESDE